MRGWMAIAVAGCVAAAAQAIGFQPERKALEAQQRLDLTGDRKLLELERAAVTDAIVNGIVTRDRDAVAAGWARMRRWNANNPGERV